MPRSISKLSPSPDFALAFTRAAPSGISGSEAAALKKLALRDVERSSQPASATQLYASIFEGIRPAVRGKAARATLDRFEVEAKALPQRPRRFTRAAAEQAADAIAKNIKEKGFIADLEAIEVVTIPGAKFGLELTFVPVSDEGPRYSDDELAEAVQDLLESEPALKRFTGIPFGATLAGQYDD